MIANLVQIKSLEQLKNLLSSGQVLFVLGERVIPDNGVWALFLNGSTVKEQLEKGRFWYDPTKL